MIATALQPAFTPAVTFDKAIDEMAFDAMIGHLRLGAAHPMLNPGAWDHRLRPEDLTWGNSPCEMDHLSYEDAKPVVCYGDPLYGFERQDEPDGAASTAVFTSDSIENDYDLRLAASLEGIDPLEVCVKSSLSNDAAQPEVKPLCRLLQPSGADDWDIPVAAPFGGLEKVSAGTPFQQKISKLMNGPGHGIQSRGGYHTPKKDSLKHREDLRKWMGYNARGLAAMCDWRSGRKGRYWKNPPDGSPCCPWRGPVDKNGIPRVARRHYTDMSARRLVWALCYCQGPNPPTIPKRLYVTCGDPLCMNPTHFSASPKTREADTHGTTVHGDRRKKNGQDNREKGECPYGHAYTPENTLRVPNSRGTGEQRVCRQCRREKRRAKAKRKTGTAGV